MFVFDVLLSIFFILSFLRLRFFVVTKTKKLNKNKNIFDDRIHSATTKRQSTNKITISIDFKLSMTELTTIRLLLLCANAFNVSVAQYLAVRCARRCINYRFAMQTVPPID